MSEPGCLRIPLDRYPGMNPFVLDWLGGTGAAGKYLPRNVETRSKSGGAGAALQKALIESNKRYGLFVRMAVEAWASGEAVTLAAGQQVGFAGGPLYTLAKIASLVKMKREIERAGRPATVFFWLATEDHDFDEVAQLNVPAALLNEPGGWQLDLITLRATRAVESRAIVGPQRIPEALIAELLAIFDLQRPQWLRDGITFGDSFAELIASIFGDEVVLVDSLLPELRRAGAPLFESIRGKWGEVQRALQKQSADLESEGYKAQVDPQDDGQYTLLFELGDDGVRHTCHPERPTEPDRTSTSALTRPLLQDLLLRPDVFVGGPAEVAYYAQIAPLYSLLDVTMPRVALRGHLLLAPKRVLRFVERFDVKPEEIFSSADELLADREPEGVAEVYREASQAQKELMRHIERIGELALPADHSLARAISRSVGHIEYHFHKLTERAVKGLVRKDKERYAAAKELIATLYPDHRVQDRVVGWFPWWRRYEQHLIDRVVSEIEPDTATFKVIGL